MLNIEKQISHLISSQFPSVYREQGDQLVAFVTAYYEWLESNCQLLTVENTTGFRVGDTIVQGPAGGEILAVSDRKLVVLSTRRLIDVQNARQIDSLLSERAAAVAANTAGPLIPVNLAEPGLPSIDTQSTMDQGDRPPVGSSVVTTRVFNSVTGEYSTRIRDLSSVTESVQDSDIFACIRFCNSLDPVISSSGAVTSIVAARNMSINRLARHIADYNDIDLTVNRFIVHFKEKYLNSINFDIASNNRLLVKNATSLYRSKGSARAVDLLFKLVYGVSDAIVYNPSEDLFTLSDAAYIRPVYLEVTASDVNVSLVGSLITGVTSGASGFVERFIRRRVNNNFVHILYMSAVQGKFINSELIRSADLYSYNNPRVVGSIDSFAIVTGSSGFEVGDLVNITANVGSGSVARVAAISSQTGVVDFELIDGGWGYSLAATSSVSEKVIEISGTLLGNTEASARYLTTFEPITVAAADIEYDTAAGQLEAGQYVYFANTTANTGSGLLISSDPIDNTSGEIFVSLREGTVSAIQSSNTINYSNGTSFANIVLVTDRTISGLINQTANNITVGVSSVTSANIARGYTATTTSGTGIVESVSITGSDATVVVSLNNSITDRMLAGQAIAFSSGTTGTISDITIRAGVVSIDGTLRPGMFVNTPINELSGNVTFVSTGSLASFSIGSISFPETIFVNTDLLAANNVANTPYMTLELDAGEYGFPKAPTANSGSVIFQALSFDDYTIGSIASLTNINPGTQYNVNPLVLTEQKEIAGFNRRDLIINIANQTSAFAPGEIISQTSASLTQYALTVGSTTGFQIGENIYQGSPTETANGTIQNISGSNTLLVRNVQGTFNTSSNVFSRLGGLTPVNTSVSDVDTESITVTARSLVKTANSSVIFAKRIQFENTWEPDNTVIGLSTGATANVVSVTEDPSTLPIGLNAVVNATTVIAPGAVSSLEVVDSGFGYGNRQLATYTSTDGSRSGSVLLIRNGQGISAGYWNNNKSMLSTDKYLQDSNFYQEYSYQIISPISFEKYRDTVLDVIHVAGTKLFGRVAKQIFAAGPTEIAESSIVSAPV